jgi:hypothetical protein
MSDGINREIANAQRKRRLGEDACCCQCGFDILAALQRDGEGVICYECRCAKEGRPTMEDQHYLGRDIDPRAGGMLGNLHRVEDDGKYAWSECVRRNTARDPLLWIAGLLLSAHDFAEFVTEVTERLADWLVLCVENLRAAYGERWWETLGLPQLWG